MSLAKDPLRIPYVLAILVSILGSAAQASELESEQIRVSLLALDPAQGSAVVVVRNDPGPRLLKVGEPVFDEGWRATLVHISATRAFFDGQFLSDAPADELLASSETTELAASGKRQAARPFEMTVFLRRDGEPFSRLEIQDPQPLPEAESASPPLILPSGDTRADSDSQAFTLHREKGLRKVQVPSGAEPAPAATLDGSPDDPPSQEP